MRSFFMVGGECWSGNTRFEHIGLHGDRRETEAAVAELIRSGGFDLAPGCGQTLVLRVYVSGDMVAEHDLFPRLRLHIPDFAELSFDAEHSPVNVVPAPDGDAEDVHDAELLLDLAAEALTERAADVGVGLDWPWPGTLLPPVLAHGDSAEVDGRRLPYGVTETFG
ncbi:hypothetical protein AB0I28_04470 [Phytomonospora sp. NPDC050363]|uniref:hypothetical protein n=1 Tax=Phytomonospora sp. NPDC050363 TaxID=3155642 RepID=UPI0033CFB456